MAAGITTSSSTICDGNPATPKFFYDANSAAAYDLNSAVNKDGTACNAKFQERHGITYTTGAIYAVDRNRIRKIKLP